MSVLFWHTSIAFFPEYTGIFTGMEDKSFRGTPVFYLMNGTAAVYLFFVLSAYVLTRKYFLTGDNVSLLRGVVKRWPRLMMPVLVAVLFSWMLFKLDLYNHAEAAKISKSPWLEKFGYAFTEPFKVQFVDALLQGSLFTFFRGDFSYDSSLWTMRPEFIGSIFAMLCAPFILWVAKRSKLYSFYLFVVAGLLIHFGMQNLMGFVAGVALALYLPRNMILNKFCLALLFIISIYLLGFSGKLYGWYILFEYINFNDKFTSYVSIIGAIVLIVVFENSKFTKRLFCGPVSAFIGDISFPLYLLHVLIIFSIGSFIYLNSQPIYAFLGTIFFSIIFALPLSRINKIWVNYLNNRVIKIRF